IMQLFGGQTVPGDVNADGKCDRADAVLLQAYLLTIESALPDWQAGDMNADGRLNGIDLTLLKREAMK
ncbi:MAG: dockerin type I repeat-containing protein, partial [Oscillospiraceae bacterium]|nr:dockerin type I repeat-containing protein [Oscillospiraceae bacterium]